MVFLAKNLVDESPELQKRVLGAEWQGPLANICCIRAHETSVRSLRRLDAIMGVPENKTTQMKVDIAFPEVSPCQDNYTDLMFNQPVRDLLYSELRVFVQ